MGANESAKDLLDAIKTVVDSILADTGTTLEAKLDAIDTIVDAILVDTGTTLEAKLDLIRTELTFQHQADANIAQTNPVQNNWYTVLTATSKVRIYVICVQVETTGETIEVRVTADGNALVASESLAGGTTYVVVWRVRADAASNKLSMDTEVNRRFEIEGRSVTVEARKTTNNGTGTLHCNVIHGKR